MLLLLFLSVAHLVCGWALSLFTMTRWLNAWLVKYILSTSTLLCARVNSLNGIFIRWTLSMQLDYNQMEYHILFRRIIIVLFPVALRAFSLALVRVMYVFSVCVCVLLVWQTRIIREPAHTTHTCSTQTNSIKSACRNIISYMYKCIYFMIAITFL